MEKRKLELENLKCYTQKIENEVTLLLQNLQWDSKVLLQNPAMSACSYDVNHKIPPNKKEIHEEACSLKREGYTTEDILFPEPLDSNSNSLVKLSADEINEIINNVGKNDPTFKSELFGCKVIYKIQLSLIQGSRIQNTVPLSLKRLQCTYTGDERRAIHDAVVNAVPSCHDLTDLALLSSNVEDQRGDKKKSRMEILAELRDMKRRRAKYRVAAKTKNYSDVLRDVIKTQMELYTEVQVENSSNMSHVNTKNNDPTKHLNKKEFVNESSRNASDNNHPKNRHGSSPPYNKFKTDFRERKRKETDTKERYEVGKRVERRYEDDRKYPKTGKNEEKGKYTENRTSIDKYRERKVKSYRDEQGYDKGKRNKDSRSSASERDKSDERRYDRYRDEKRQRYDETHRDRIKRHDEIKKEKFDDYEEWSEEKESHKRNKQEKYKRYYE